MIGNAIIANKHQRLHATQGLAHRPGTPTQSRLRSLRSRQANFAVSSVPNISFGFQLSVSDQNLHTCVNFFCGDSNPTLFACLQGISDDPCNLQPTVIAEG
jgi:hypothetical protein